LAKFGLLIRYLQAKNHTLFAKNFGAPWRRKQGGEIRIPRKLSTGKNGTDILFPRVTFDEFEELHIVK